MTIGKLILVLDKGVTKLMQFYALFLMMWIFIGSMIEAHRTNLVFQVLNPSYSNEILYKFAPAYFSLRNIGLLFVLIPHLLINFIVYIILKTRKIDTFEIKNVIGSSVVALVLLILAFALAGLMLDLAEVGKEVAQKMATN